MTQKQRAIVAAFKFIAYVCVAFIATAIIITLATAIIYFISAYTPWMWGVGAGALIFWLIYATALDHIKEQDYINLDRDSKQNYINMYGKQEEPSLYEPKPSIPEQSPGILTPVGD